MKKIKDIFISKSIEDTHKYASLLAETLQPGSVVCLNGDLGAGKTLLVQALAKIYGVSEDVVSPTFNILLEYHSGKIPIYHFDLYRLNFSEELEDIGFYEVVESDGISFIEWADKFRDEMPDSSINIDIKVMDDHSRKMIKYYLIKM